MADLRARYAVAEALKQILQDSESGLSDIRDHSDIDDDIIPPPTPPPWKRSAFRKKDDYVSETEKERDE